MNALSRLLKFLNILFENLKVKKTFFKLARESDNKVRRSCNDKNDYSSLHLKNNQESQNLVEAQNFDKFSIDKINSNLNFRTNKLIISNRDNNKDNTKLNNIYIKNEASLNLPFNDSSSKNENKGSKDNNRQILKTFFKTQYIRKSLFPFKCYLCSIFINFLFFNFIY